MSSQRKFTAVALIPGKTYRVINDFVDYDDLVHSTGESWTFVSHSFLPYEDGLTIFTERDGKAGTFRLQWREEAQGQIIDHFSNYVEEL